MKESFSTISQRKPEEMVVNVEGEQTPRTENDLEQPEKNDGSTTEAVKETVGPENKEGINVLSILTAIEQQVAQLESVGYEPDEIAGITSSINVLKKEAEVKGVESKDATKKLVSINKSLEEILTQAGVSESGNVENNSENKETEEQTKKENQEKKDDIDKKAEAAETKEPFAEDDISPERIALIDSETKDVITQIEQKSNNGEIAITPEQAQVISDAEAHLNLLRSYSISSTEQDQVLRRTKLEKYVKDAVKYLDTLKKIGGIDPEPEKDDSNDLEEKAGDKAGSAEKVDDRTPYKEARKEWKEIRSQYVEKEKDYKNAFEEYYNNRSWGTKAKEGIGKLFGMDPELPVGLQVMRDSFKDLKSRYAESLNKAMLERSKVKYEGIHADKKNKEYSLETDEAKKAYVQKFILKPNQELLEIQKNSERLSLEKQGVLNRVMRLMSKYKWHTRGGIVLMAGVAGMATAGVGAALVGAGGVAARMGIGLGAGAGTGAGFHKGLQGRVDRSEKKVESAISEANEKFSLETLKEAEKKLQEAEAEFERRKLQQKGWSTIAGGIAGGVAGYSAGGMMGSAVAGNEDSFINAEDIGHKVTEFKEDIPTFFGDSPDIEKMVLVMGDNNIEISGIKIEGVNDYADILTEAEKVEVNEFMQETLLELYENKEYTQADIEDLNHDLLEKMEEKFGDEDWWHEVGVKEINFEEIKSSAKNSEVTTNAKEAMTKGAFTEDHIREIQENHGYNKDQIKSGAFTTDHLKQIQEERGYKPPETELNAYSEKHLNQIQHDYGENGALIEKPSEYSYTVESGDNLWNIVEDQFKTELDKLPSEQHQNHVTGQLIEKIRSDEALRTSIELDNYGKKIDRIYPGDEIYLDSVGEELKNLVQKELDNPTNFEAPAEVVGSVSEAVSSNEAAASTMVPEEWVKLHLPGSSPEQLTALQTEAREIAAKVLAEQPNLPLEQLHISVENNLIANHPELNLNNLSFGQNLPEATATAGLGPRIPEMYQHQAFHLDIIAPGMSPENLRMVEAYGNEVAFNKLTENPFLRHEQLRTEVWQEIEKKFGGQSWWQAGKPTAFGLSDVERRYFVDVQDQLKRGGSAPMNDQYGQQPQHPYNNMNSQYHGQGGHYGMNNGGLDRRGMHMYPRNYYNNAGVPFRWGDVHPGPRNYYNNWGVAPRAGMFHPGPRNYGFGGGFYRNRYNMMPGQFGGARMI